VTSTVIDGEAVVVNLTTGVYYSMDGTGGAVWQMIEEGRSLEEMARALAARYETTPEQALSDLSALLPRLMEETLVVATDGPPTSAAPAPQAAPEARAPYAAPNLNIYRDMEDLLALDPPMPGLRDIPSQEPDDASRR